LSGQGAWRSNGNWGLAKERMREARNILQVFDANETRLLSAATWKQGAWNYMIQWRFREARQNFERAQQILKKNVRQEQFQTYIDQFHVEHGLALVERYQGKPDEALRKYRQLTPRIAAKIRELDESRTDRDNYVEIRALLYQRLVNSLERQGDCNLFSPLADFAEAADDYRRAIRECPHAPADDYVEVTANLLYKRAIAISLESRSQDLGLAGFLEKEAAAIIKDKPVSDSLQFMKVLATSIRTFFECPSILQRQELLAKLRAAIVKRRKQCDTQIERDDLEALVFSAGLLLEWQELLLNKGELKDSYLMGNDATLLFELCGMARQTTTPDPDTLKYLRPYYDAVLTAKLALKPKHVKELIEIAWEATRGAAYEKPEQPEALLVLCWTGGKCCLLLDEPSGLSKAYPVPEVQNVEDLRVERPDKDLLVLPDELRKDLRLLSRAPVVRWHDPVLRLGYPSVRIALSVPADAPADPTSLPGNGKVLEPSRDSRFPFDLKSVFGQDKCREDTSKAAFSVEGLERMAVMQKVE
jgi:hypothetical protein